MEVNIYVYMYNEALCCIEEINSSVNQVYFNFLKRYKKTSTSGVMDMSAVLISITVSGVYTCGKHPKWYTLSMFSLFCINFTVIKNTKNIFIGRTDAKVPLLWSPDVKSQFNAKDLDAGKAKGKGSG